jgi:hypothetical protein
MTNTNEAQQNEQPATVDQPPVDANGSPLPAEVPAVPIAEEPVQRCDKCTPGFGRGYLCSKCSKEEPVRPVATPDRVHVALSNALALAECLPGGRAAALVKTKIEEAQLWLAKVPA